LWGLDLTQRPLGHQQQLVLQDGAQLLFTLVIALDKFGFQIAPLERFGTAGIGVPLPRQEVRLLDGVPATAGAR
jgi:hypothetical protein